MNVEHWCSCTDRGNRSAGRQPCPVVTLSTINLTRTGQKSNPVLRRDRSQFCFQLSRSCFKRVPNREHLTSCLFRIHSSYVKNKKLYRQYKEQPADAFRKIIDYISAAIRTALKFVGKCGVHGGRNWCECGGLGYVRLGWVRLGESSVQVFW